jgi:hypothetical protein
MKSSKWMIGLMAMMLMLAFSSSSFAQVQLQIFNTASPGEIVTNKTANTSDPTSTGSGILVSGQLIAVSPLTTTGLILTFPGPITSAGVNDRTWGGVHGGTGPLAGTYGHQVPSVDPIRIEGATGLFANVTAITTINFANGTIRITLPCWNAADPACGNGNNNQSGSFRLVGVRIDANGKTAPLNVTASLSSSANNYIAPGNSSLPIINSLGPGIASMTQSAVTGSNDGAFLVFSNQASGNFADSLATMVIQEGFAAAWRTPTQASTSTTPLPNGTNIRLTFNGLPSGFSITITTRSSSSARPGVNMPAAVTLTRSSTNPSPSTVISFSSTNLTGVENLQLDLVLGGSTSSTLSPGNITVTATMDPIGDVFATGTSATNRNDYPTEANGYLIFAQADVGPLTIGAIAPANTVMLIPYAVKSGFYDTGIAIANTSKDPFGSAGGGATPAAGNITFTLYPRTDTGAGTERTVVTSATIRPGVGLATDGTLAAGGTWTGLVTDLLTAAGQTGDFFGYIFIQCNFVVGHGASYIFDGRGFTSASPVLILPPPASFPRAGVEALNN